MNLLAITNIERNNKSFVSYITLNENREFVDFQLFEAEGSLVDRIYIGRVENIVSNINAAFVSISEKQKCYLPLEHFENAIFVKKQSEKKVLSEGDYILVQVTKDAVKTKDPVVSEKLSLHSKYCVLTTGNKSFGISKKIAKEENKRLNAILDEIKKDVNPNNYGIVLRTDSAFASSEELKADILSLIDEYEYLINVQTHRSMHSLVYENLPGYISRIKSTNFEQIDAIYTDSNSIFDKIQLALPAIYQNKLHFYKDDKISLKTLYNLEGNIDKLISNKVWLKSGANIIIEQLETITFIDVNTAKNISKEDDVIMKVNKEAAIEIARQLRLRNISGMIIIDFINLDTEEKQLELEKHMKALLIKDVIPCQFIDYTKLGLVELTRKKRYSSLKEIL